ncbi:ligase-associated DNA damage response DEXH box helicase [Jannaschia seohaensis]|uniref:ATP-dependent Lhr-like helicase n=1 Tax=Jannaschia seohaensis TaxID=475081 RepID=A0A2Y9B1G3_9RHOB|nr:ligase-associated DNA damage response DEXH box helicase [Jannaschia seohaensis]PWJ15026.1 ATP-dependent Lhr-like helicase [Jannaschia seohaensis]SSA49875.1 ATP-dependent helicase Lhr and Lhr-like helicase [Jannaschia seohaensis]
MNLPAPLADFFARRHWTLHPHQQEMLARKDLPALLLIAPTGGGKTLAGFLPTLAEIAEHGHEGLHTLYVSPLKALANDIRRNLATPIKEAGLPIRVEDRTGDTSQTRRKRQRADPPHILLTTPESLALMISYPDAARTFAGLKRIIVDEIHALADNKRGDQLMLCLSRLQTLAPGLRRVGLSATVDDPAVIAHYLARHPDPCPILHADPGPPPDIDILRIEDPPPWAGAGGRYAIPAVLEQVRRHNTTLIFHNTRAQAEIFFHHLWLANEDALPIGIHHGALSKEARLRVEQAMVAGELKAIVATGSLDLGIDWGDVDLVIQVGAPKKVKNLVQRIGRANHRYNAPSKARLVPANRFEVIECAAALEAVRAGELDGDLRLDGPRDVLCQHIACVACAGDFSADTLFAEVRSVGPYSTLPRAAFDDCLDFVATGGYALRAYDRYQRLQERSPGVWGLRDPRSARQIRMNLGTIVDTDKLKVRFRGRGGQPLGEIEEGFAATLTPGDTFLMGGQIVRYEGMRELTVEVSPRPDKEPRIATYVGYKWTTSVQLAHRIQQMLHETRFDALPDHTRHWLELQARYSTLPEPGRLLVEQFPRDGRHHTVVYGFAGVNAHQTLALLITKGMEERGLDPLGFVSNDYATLIWGLKPAGDIRPLLTRVGIAEALDGWLKGNAVMKRTFRNAAIIAGLIDRNFPGKRSTGRQAAFSSDILYDTLRRYDPDHLMLRITEEEAMRGHIDFGRLELLLETVGDRVDQVRLDRVTPLAAPLFLERGIIPIKGRAEGRLLEEEAAKLMAEAGLSLD